MADVRSTEQATPAMPGDQRYERHDGDQHRANVVDRLGQFWQAAQMWAGFGNNRQPTPRLSEELRHGQQEAASIGQDLADIGQDLQVLVQQEMALARAEMQQQMRLSSRAIGWGLIGLVFMCIKFAFLAVAGMFALALVMPLWLSALIVAGALLVVELFAGLVAYQRFRQIRMVPQRTVESVKEDIRWIGGQLTSSGE